MQKGRAKQTVKDSSSSVESVGSATPLSIINSSTNEWWRNQQPIVEQPEADQHEFPGIGQRSTSPLTYSKILGAVLSFRLSIKDKKKKQKAKQGQCKTEREKHFERLEREKLQREELEWLEYREWLKKAGLTPDYQETAALTEVKPTLNVQASKTVAISDHQTDVSHPML